MNKLLMITTVVWLCFLTGLDARSEVYKKFELTSVLLLDQGDKNDSTWSLGNQFRIRSNDPSINKHFTEMKGMKVRVLVYVIND